MKKDDVITTGLGRFSKEKFNALLDIRSIALNEIRNKLASMGYTEVSTSSLVNIAGSCENPHASFTLNYYGREAHLSQSAQLQLEALVIRLKRPVFTVNNSFREENYDDPETAGRRLSEFTLIEAEKPYREKNGIDILHDHIIRTEEQVIKQAISGVLFHCRASVELLGGDYNYLRSVLDTGLWKF